MPLYEADGSIDPATLKTVPDHYIIFYSSVVDGQMWCPDCRAVEELVKEAFSEDSPASGLIVYVGDRTQWKTPSNIYRQNPWHISSVPTIVKLIDGKEVDRLVDDAAILKNLKEFVKSG
ncbi:hypothetical protein BDN70DRAFT_902643 [Pholiota conissans]|uniref:Thioredoxin domain-containing protein n=1 Tax=Pholiota conissans TaxID=109636 RepID=A0A9P5ZF49_9AGAR|nr:hypothetical protein BDN70DRAFT_902643 [Pholiota conissans]